MPVEKFAFAKVIVLYLNYVNNRQRLSSGLTVAYRLKCRINQRLFKFKTKVKRIGKIWCR